MQPVQPRSRAASVETAGRVGIRRLKLLVTANTNDVETGTLKYYKKTGQEAKRTRKATSRQAHEPASRRAHKRASRQAHKRSSVQRFANQQALNIGPIIRCEGRYFTIVCKQTEDRGTFIKFYRRGRGLFDKDKITLLSGQMK